jgi:hypothetical protein
VVGDTSANTLLAIKRVTLQVWVLLLHPVWSGRWCSSQNTLCA